MNPIALLNNPMVMKAVGAMMRGEDPKAFMKNLADTNPKLQGFDLNDLEGTAKALCEKNNINMSELSAQIQEFANSNTK